MANATVNRQVNVYINSGEAQKAYDVLIAKEKKLNEELAKTSDPKRIKALTAELDKMKEPIERATKKLKGELSPTIKDLQQSMRKLVAEFERTGDPKILSKIQGINAQYKEQKALLYGLDNAQQKLTKGGIFSAAFWASLASSALTRVTSLIGNLFGGVIKEALDADESTKRLESTLNNLGRGDSFQRITRQAQELARQFRYLDNDDIVAVFNKLIDYGKLTEREMNNLLPVIINFAAKSKISIDESADVIIKALEGNGKALKAYGIDIKDAGSETERLNIIMTTLNEKAKGAGEAFQKTARGGIAIARQELNNLKEDIGNAIIPALNNLLSRLLKGGRRIQTFFRAMRDGFSGKNGFITMALGEVSTSDPKIKSQVDEIIEQTVVSFKNLDKYFDTKTKEGRDALEKARKSRIDALNQSILEDQQRIAELQKQSGKSGMDEAHQLLIGIIARQEAIADIEDSLNESLDKTLGIPGSGDLKDKTKEVELLAHSVKDLHNELIELYRAQNEQIQKGGSGAEAAKRAFGLQMDFDKTFADTIANITANANRSNLAGLELKILNSRGKQRLEAELALLKEQERQELLNKNLTENEKMLIEAQFRIRRGELEKDFQAQQVDNLVNYYNTALTLFDAFDQIKTGKENAELERDRYINEQKRANLERRLKAGHITKLQYDREQEKLDKERERKEKEIRKKQFERQKIANLAQAAIDGVMAVLQVIRTVPKVIPGTIIPNPQFPIALGLAIAAKLSAIATIAAQKAPQFAEGGKLGGRSHSSGGNAVVDGRGNKIAEVEAGEGIVNKRTMGDRRSYSVSGTPGQIISSLNGLYGKQWEGGATLIPGWRSYSPKQMNFSNMKQVYAAGGVFSEQNGTKTASQDAIFQNFSGILSDMQRTLQDLQANGIIAYTVITQHEKQQARIDASRQEATMVK